jgi:hypothetical protein
MALLVLLILLPIGNGDYRVERRQLWAETVEQCREVAPAVAHRQTGAAAVKWRCLEIAPARLGGRLNGSPTRPQEDF